MIEHGIFLYGIRTGVSYGNQMEPVINYRKFRTESVLLKKKLKHEIRTELSIGSTTVTQEMFVRQLNAKKNSIKIKISL